MGNCISHLKPYGTNQQICTLCSTVYDVPPDTPIRSAPCRRIDLNARPKPSKLCGGCDARQEAANNWWPELKLGDKFATIAKPTAKGFTWLAEKLWLKRPRLLVEFSYGLGDDVQFCTVLRHLRRLYPKWIVEVVAHHRSHEMYRLAGARRCYDQRSDSRRRYEYTSRISIADPEGASRWHPMTKAELVLDRYFGIQPRPELAGYHVRWRRKHTRGVNRGLKSIDVKPQEFVLMHYQGDSAKSRKNMSPEIAQGCVKRIVTAGFRVLVFDFGGESKLVDGENVIRVDIPADPCYTAALANLSRLNLGIDSGPGHVFGSRFVKTPAVIYWRKHHPYQYYQPADHVLHVLPRQYWNYIRGDGVSKQKAKKYFQTHYRYHPVVGQPQFEVPNVVAERLAAFQLGFDRQQCS